jgi:hypothetical protein
LVVVMTMTVGDAELIVHRPASSPSSAQRLG